MAGDQTNANETIVQAEAEAKGGAIQANVIVRAERTQNIGPRLGRPMMKQPTFNWKAEDKNNELKTSD